MIVLKIAIAVLFFQIAFIQTPSADAEFCDLPPVVGDCDAAIPRYFFNSTSQRCETFTYGGCGGNANNFASETECATTCRSGPYTCILQPNPGICLAGFQQYFYNVTSGRCETFTYGGCEGNDNRFNNFEECDRTCKRSNNICGLEPVSGVCEAYIPSYFYNVTSKRCEEFVYGGCGGNDNRFSTLDQCQALCGVDVCTLQPETGNCRGSFPRYFYNMFTRRCELFVYGGCGGNGNRFSDVRSCNETCGLPNTNVDICSLKPESGPCEAEFPSYFYNATTKRCEMFIYGGCDGNDNRFSTSEECSAACSEGLSICNLQPESGPCLAYIPSYFYNATSKSCEMFGFGGCGGNGNRFDALEDCYTACSQDAESFSGAHSVSRRAAIVSIVIGIITGLIQA